MRNGILIKLLLPVAALLCGVQPGWAEDILIGHVSGYTGPVSKDANDLHLGAKIFFDNVNEKGGYEGRKFRIVTADDKYNPAETLRLVGAMIGKASALLPTTGSAGLLSVIKSGILDRASLPIVGAVPSPISSRVLQRNIFHFRAGDRDQITALTRQLVTVGYRDICIVMSENPFGLQAGDLAEKALAGHGAKADCKPIFKIAPSTDFSGVIAALKSHPQQAIIVFAPPKAVVETVVAIRQAGVRSPVYTLSYTDHQMLIDALGQRNAAGIGIVQVMPNLNKTILPLIRSFQDDYEKFGGTTQPPTYFNLEGYVSARLIYEAIRKSKDASAEGVRRGLEQMQNIDLGGFLLSFSPDNHTGSRFVDLSVITSSGRLIY
ncbi:ABC transporter substrate-binding protein [Noviherbaspirillum cavernae]|nr:ABC transporter substrate-binding protein [Noviherbaspirillum cavernae]